MKLPKFIDCPSPYTQDAVPVAARWGFDGYGWTHYLDNGSGSDWLKRATQHDDVELLYTHPPQPSETVTEEALCSEILAELTRARTKFPGKNVTFAALVEEVGELATATFEESADRVRKEAVQVAVMAMRMILDGDDCYEPWRAEKGLDPLDPALRTLKGNV